MMLVRPRSSFLLSLVFLVAVSASRTSPFGTLVNAIKGGGASRNNGNNKKKDALTTSPSPVFPSSLDQNNIIDNDNDSSWTDGFVGSDDPTDNEFLPPLHMSSHPLLQMPCSLQTEDQTGKITPTSTFVDTGAQVSVLSYAAARRAGVLHLLDRRYAGHAMGVGQCRVLGRLPAGAILLHVLEHKLAAPAITILEDTNQGVDLLLGLDFLREYQAILNLREEEISLLVGMDADTGKERTLLVPFIRPRARLAGIGDEKHDEQDGDDDYDNEDSGDCLADRICANSDQDETIDMSGV
jgi:Aspartyl protease